MKTNKLFKKVVKLFSAVSFLICSCCFISVFAAPEIITDMTGRKIMVIDKAVGTVALEPIESLRPNFKQAEHKYTEPENYYINKFLEKYLDKTFIPTCIIYKGASYIYKDPGVIEISTNHGGAVFEAPLWTLSVLGKKATRPFGVLSIAGNFERLMQDFLCISDGSCGPEISLQAIYMKQMTITVLSYRSFHDVSGKTLKILELPDTIKTTGMRTFYRSNANPIVKQALQQIEDRKGKKSEDTKPKSSGFFGLFKK